MSQNLQNIAKFQKFQLENLVDFEKCCKTHIFLQKSEPIQPETSNILPKFCQKLATTLRVRRAAHVDAARAAHQHRDLGEGELHPHDLEGRLLRRARLAFRRVRRLVFPISKIGKISKILQIFGGLVLGCIKTKFCKKYAFDSICQALQDLHTFAPVQSQNFSKKSV